MNSSHITRPSIPALLFAFGCACTASVSVSTKGESPTADASTPNYCDPDDSPDVPPCPQCKIDKSTDKLSVVLDSAWISQISGGRNVTYQFVSADVELTASSGTSTCTIAELRMTTDGQIVDCAAPSDLTAAVFQITVKPDVAPDQRCEGQNSITVVGE